MYAELIRVIGTVQGVGFRPHVWQIARQLGVVGTVCNDASGVLIEAWATPAILDEFSALLVANKPPLAIIEQVCRETLPASERPEDFLIINSGRGEISTGVSTDAATCPACLAEMNDPNNRRYGYPFTNCTHCGPRFSIIHRIPYDRANTSMSAFTMCAQCQAEYDNPADRRFHAQPNACPDCGPKLWLENNSGQPVPGPINQHAIDHAAELIAAGFIIAIKGVGGIHLACDALNASAVRELRKRKRRPTKPLALMVKDARMASDYAVVSNLEAELLNATAAPIVLLPKQITKRQLPEEIAPNQPAIGIMLPYSPLHHWLLQKFNGPTVLTSGNLSDEPQCIDNQEARTRLAHIADYFLLHDRDIVNRIDDSVVRVVAGNARIIRHARGYAPQRFTLPPGFNGAENLMAAGADLKNTFCLQQQNRAIISQYIGDLDDVASQQDYRKNIALYQQLYQFQASAVIADKHPNYRSTLLAETWAAENNKPLVSVQHHHAHIAAAMAELGLAKDCPPVLGIALDGLGFGDDDHFWGGEFLLANYQQCRRVARFKPAAMLGGNVAMKEPWRNTVAHLMATGHWPQWADQHASLELMQFLAQKPLPILQSMAEKNLNSPLSSSAGRLFDAVAAALNLCREHQTYEGEAAIALETAAMAVENTAELTPFDFAIDNNKPLPEIDWTPMWAQILGALKDGALNDGASNEGALNDGALNEGATANTLAYRFHLTVVQAVTKMATLMVARWGCSQVVLSGGVFQNKLLTELLLDKFSRAQLNAFLPAKIPCNDSAIALGQLMVCHAGL